MGQSDVWKKKRPGLAGALRDSRKSWLSSGDAGPGAREQAQEQGSADRNWRAPQPGAASRLIEE